MATIELEFDGAILTDEHSASSYGQPVLVYAGRAYGPADTVPTDTAFGDEPAYRMGQRGVGRGSKDFTSEQLTLQAKWDAAGERLGLSKW